MSDFLIAPSLLSANVARLGAEAEAVLAAGGDFLHLDVMDNHYVPNLTFGPLVCAGLRKFGITAPIDVHLMTTSVDPLISAFAQAGASHITFHPECSENINKSLDLIHSFNCKAGVAINPSTSLDCLEKIINKIDIMLMMTVNPGFAGQAFIPAVLEKIKMARKLIDSSGRSILLAVDGGINGETISQTAAAGAEMFVAGSAIFGAQDYKAVISGFRQELKKVQENAK